MKALTLTEPYASLIARGIKRIETRSWPTSYRGPVAIHAAKGFGPLRALGYPGTLDGMREMIWDTRPLWEACNAASDGPGGPLSCGWLDQGRVFPLPFMLALGRIIAVAELVDCVPTKPTTRDEWRRFPLISECERACGDYSPGRFAWVLANVRQVKSAKCTGAQKIWTVPADVVVGLRLWPSGAEL